MGDHAQQQLLDALRREMGAELALLWRTVAIAMAWIEGLGNRTRDLPSEGGDLLLIHLGAESVDITRLAVVPYPHEGSTIWIPKRNGRGWTVPIGVLDLVANRVEAYLREPHEPDMHSSEAEAIWHSLLTPELAWYSGVESLPESTCYLRGSWRSFDPVACSRALSAAAAFRRSPFLASLGRRAITFSDTEDHRQIDVPEAEDLIGSWLADDHKPVLGVVVSGISEIVEPDMWTSIPIARSLRGFPSHPVPQLGAAWVPRGASEVIASGTYEHARRLRDGLPTYVDHLHELSVYAQTENGMAWVPIIREGDVEGGSEHRDIISERFALESGALKLRVFLRMWDDRRQEQAVRKTEFLFPHAPASRTLLDVEVVARPAGGRAHVEMVPSVPGPLSHERVFLDWDDMEEATEEDLPTPVLAYPPLEPDFEVHEGDARLLSLETEAIFRAFLRANPSHDNYDDALKALHRRLAAEIRMFRPENPGWVSFRFLRRTGRTNTPQGQERITALRDKLDHDFRQLASIRRSTKLVTAGAWLFDACPKSIRRYLQDMFASSDRVRFTDVWAAGRVFGSKEECSLYFKKMYEHSVSNEKEERWYKHYWLYSCRRLLMTRTEAIEGLTRRYATDFMEGLCDDLESWIRSNQKNGFGATLRLMFALLRFRQVDASFLAPGSDEDRELRERIETVINFAHEKVIARDSFLRGRTKEAASEVLRGFCEFLDKKGTMSTIILLDAEFAEGAAEG